MNYSDSEIREELHYISDQLEESLEWLQEGKLDDDNVTTLNHIASSYSSVAKCHTLLGEISEAIDAFENAAQFYFEALEVCWVTTDESTRRRIPSFLTGSIGNSLIAQDDDLSTKIAKHGGRLAKQDISAFLLGSGRPLERFNYYKPQLYGMLFLEVDRRDLLGEEPHGFPPVEEMLDAHRSAANALGDPKSIAMSNVFYGLVEDGQHRVAENIDRGLQYHEEERIGSEPDKFHHLVAVTQAQLIHLADRRGMEIHIESGYLPSAVLPDGVDS